MKRILVSGSNKGIGLAIVKDLLRRGDCEAILCSRSLENGELAKAEILAEDASFASRLTIQQLDVTNDESIAACTASLLAAYGQRSLYALVNNAGVAFNTPEIMLSTNFWGVKKMIEACASANLFQEEGARVVSISSGSGPMFTEKISEERKAALCDSNVTFETIQENISAFLTAYNSGGMEACTAIGFGSGDASFYPYGMTKAMLNAYTLYATRTMPNLQINACSPGMIKTALFQPWADKQGKSIDELASDIGALDVSESTKSTLFLLFEADSSVRGQYFGSDALRSPMHKYRSTKDPAYDGADGN